MLTFLTERHICVYKRDIDNALGKYRKYMGGRRGTSLCETRT